MGRGGQTTAKAEAAAKPDDASEVLIEGQLYDVSGFRHPGGSIIKFLQGEGDATDAFREFHGRSRKAYAMLKSLPKRDVHAPAVADVKARRFANGKEKLQADFAAFRAELEAEGYFDPDPTHVFWRFVEILAMHAVGAWLVRGGLASLVGAAGAGWCAWVAGVMILGLASGRCGWLMHEGGHYSLTGNIKVDRALQVVTYGVGCGMSGAWWRNQHNKHHATPQKLQHDVDLDTLPLVAFHAKIIAKAKHPVMKAWLKMQGYLFMPVSCGLVASGWQFYLHPRHILRIKHHGEALALVTRYALFFGLLCHGYSWAGTWATYNLYNWVASSYIFTNFSLSHTHLPVTNADEYIHWVEYAASHTTNLSNHWLCNWWMAYLNFQIEHHLFPSAPQYRHPTIAPRVRALFERNGLKYDVRPYFSCLAQTLANLHEVGNLEIHHGGKSE